MSKIKSGLILELILFIIILIFAIRPVENFDFWFHVKYGEYILQTKTLPFTDVFSHTAYGESAVPYEWLFQVVLYSIYKTMGNAGVQALVVALALTYTFLFRQILKEIFQVPLIPRLFLVGFLFVIGYDFWVERPQSAAYAIFMAVLYLILKRVFTGKSPIFLTIPLFLIWTNLHASMILGLYLFFSFAAVSLILLLRSDLEYSRSDLVKTARDLFLFGAINTFITILPPLGTKVYQLLILFFEKRDFITLVISEWVPLYELGIRYHIYLVVMAVAGASLLWTTWSYLRRQESSKLTISKWDVLYFLPFIPLGLFVISGVRQTQFSMPVILLSLVPAIKLLAPKLKLNIIFITVITVIIFISLISSLYFYRQVATGILRLYPHQAIPFIKANLKGNMFNEYSRGGYLMYHLGPDIKTFIDGRTDMFLPKVLPQYDELLNKRYTDDQFREKFNQLVDQYQISWAILTTERFTPLRRLARLLREDPSWQLVFFDDTTDIYVRKSGLNESVIKNFALKSATPFAKRLYKEGQKDRAKAEYQRMQDMAPSAVSLNALGYLLLEDKKFKEAEQYFLQALKIYPLAAAPKMNLAELSLSYSNIKQAIELYQQAIQNEPDRGLAYLRLGQLIIQSGGSKIEAKKIWQKGLTSTPDEDILKQLKQALDSY